MFRAILGPDISPAHVHEVIALACALIDPGPQGIGGGVVRFGTA